MSLKKLFKCYMKTPDPTKAHAILSASGSERWIGCPGSVRMSKGIPPVDSEASVRGTNTHTLIQFIHENRKWRQYLADPDANAFKEHIGLDEPMLDSAISAVEYVQGEAERLKLLNGHTPEVQIEKKVELKGVGFGTSDAIIFQPFTLLHVIDYKNGKYKVDPHENTQGLYYAVAAADEVGWDFPEVWITIIQPNAGKKNPITTWKTTPEKLEDAGRMLRLAAKRTKDPNAPLVTNPKWCWFCPARQICPAQMDEKTAKIADKFKRSEPTNEAMDFCDTF